MISKKIVLVALLWVPIIACSNENTDNSDSIEKVSVPTKQKSAEMKSVPVLRSKINDGRKFLLNERGDYFVYKQSSKGSVRASLFSTSPVDPSAQFKRILWVLKTTQAKKVFIDMVNERLVNSRQFKKENFTLPLIDMEGQEYEFSYTSNHERRLYVLNYVSKGQK